VDYLSYLVLGLQVAAIVLLSYTLYTVLKMRKSMVVGKVAEIEYVPIDSVFGKRVSGVLDSIEMVRSDINELRVLIDEVNQRVRSVEQALERVASGSKAMVSAESTRSEEPVRDAPLFADLNDPAVREIYEYLKKRREEREKRRKRSGDKK